MKKANKHHKWAKKMDNKILNPFHPCGNAAPGEFREGSLPALAPPQSDAWFQVDASIRKWTNYREHGDNRNHGNWQLSLLFLHQQTSIVIHRTTEEM